MHSPSCHCIVSYGVAWYCIVGFGARAVSRKTPIYFMVSYGIAWYCIRTLPRGGMYWKIHSPRPKRFPKGGDFAPRGPRDWDWEILSLGAVLICRLEIALGLHPWEISWASGGVFSDTSLLSAVYGFNNFLFSVGYLLF